MADMMEVSSLKNCKILVEVVEALDDLLVVSFKYPERIGSTKHFQGVLLNSKKKNWPLGVINPSCDPGGDDRQQSLTSGLHQPQITTFEDIPGATTGAAFMVAPLQNDHHQQHQPLSINNLDSDRLYAVRRRYTYFQGVRNAGSNTYNIHGGTSGQQGLGSTGPACTADELSPGIMSRRNSMARSSSYGRRFCDKSARTMRLRPRQVLCSKCKSICNENSENVQVANAFKSRSTSATIVSNSPASAGHPVVSLPKIAAAQLKNDRLTAFIGPTTFKLEDNHRHNQQKQYSRSSPAGNTSKAGGQMVLRKRRLQNEQSGAPPSCQVGQSDPSSELGPPASTPMELVRDSALTLPPGPSLLLIEPVENSKETMSMSKKFREFPKDDMSKLDQIISTEAGTKPVGIIEARPGEDIEATAELQLQALKQKKTSPFIKISFGPQGTVIKIPPRTHTYIASDNESDSLQDPQDTLRPLGGGGGGESAGSSPAYRHFRAKAAKKALKKAKKDAQKVNKIGMSPLATSNSPLRQSALSTLDSSSSASALFELTHKSKHHKHKFKHKRKHRLLETQSLTRAKDGRARYQQQLCVHVTKVDVDEDKKGQEDRSPLKCTLRHGSDEEDFLNEEKVMNTNGVHDDVINEEEDVDAGRQFDNGDRSAVNEFIIHDGSWDSVESTNGHRGPTDTYSKIKKECLRQKLSISLKRLSEKSYMKCSPTYINSNSNSNHDDSNGSSIGGAPGHGHSHRGMGSNESSEAGDIPEFPESIGGESPPPSSICGSGKDPTTMIRPLMMRITSFNVGSFTLPDGRIISIGDVVWGKIHGFPWWPGKVLSISVSQRDNGLLVTQQAHVAWFGSSTSSQMPCSQLVPFLEDFKLRYNKKKRGPYKEAIKQATLAAQQVLRSVGIMDNT